MPKETRLTSWLSKFVSGAGLSGKSIRHERTTTPAKAAEHESNKRLQTAYPGTAGSPRTWLLRSMRTETKFYLASGLAGIVIASMVRTLSEARSKVNEQPTEE